MQYLHGSLLFILHSVCFLHKYSHLLNHLDRTLTGIEKAKRWLRYCMAIITQQYNYALLLMNATLQFVEICF